MASLQVGAASVIKPPFHCSAGDGGASGMSPCHVIGVRHATTQPPHPGALDFAFSPCLLLAVRRGAHAGTDGYSHANKYRDCHFYTDKHSVRYCDANSYQDIDSHAPDPVCWPDLGCQME